MVLQQQLRDLDGKIEDVRFKVSDIAVSQAKQAGQQEVLATKLDSFKETVQDRIEALETGRSRDEWRAWAERLAAAFVGAGGLSLAQHWLSK